MTVEMVRTFDGDETVIDHVVAEVLAQLARTKGASAEVTAVRALVEREWALHDDAPVRTFLPVLVVRAVIGQVVGHH